MEEDRSFLKFLIDEEIYVIPEDKPDNATREAPANWNKKDPNLKFEGKSVLLLEYPEDSPMPDDLSGFLAKILKAVHLDPDKVEKVFSDQLEVINTESFSGCIVIAFLSQVPANLSLLFSPVYYNINTSGKNNFLLCDPLEMISKDKILKKKLWEQLQVLYGTKK
jgi:hypothetical protein